MFTKTRSTPPRSSEPSSQARSSRRDHRQEPSNGRSGSHRPATLGPSVSISGNLSGNEDLVIEGSVEGEVMVKDHMVTISQSGRVKADVYGRSICIEGEVHGNLVGDEQVIIRESGRVRGNVTAPRVNLENGAKFKGSIDMQPAEAPRSAGGSKAPEPRGSNARSAATAVGVAGGKA